MAVWSIVNFSQIPFDWRLDAEYFKPEYLKLDNLLSNANVELWGNLKGKFITGPFGSAFAVENYVEHSPYRYVRGKDVKPFFLLEQDNAYIPKSAFQGLKKYSLFPEDLLVSVVGTLGNVAIVNEDIGQAIYSCKSTVYRSKSIDPYYLCTYLNSNIGQAYLQRKSRGAIQAGLNLDDLYTIPIYIPEFEQQKEIRKLVITSWEKLKISKTLYAEAEDLLLHELGLNKLDLSTQKSYVANFSETVESNRLDAEYYNPKYTVLINYLHNIPHSKLGYLASFSNGATPSGAKYLDKGKGIPFIRIQNVTKNRLDLDDVVYIDKKIHNGILKRSQLQPGDVLITITGRIGTAAVIPDSLLFANMNQHSVRLRIHNAQINPYYLSVFLNSKAGLLQTDREAYGATRDALPYYCLEKIIIPIASLDLQKQVEVKVREAEKTLQEAKTLLERAKHQVEQIILGG
ncbi:hypothetical protein A6769_03460 [Nostoc punctiforme NIES-2108]|uniref:Type I restriction modification DNA specificity domain-containing protein n=1 Tax=Nostoc punctiforme NIES-2108 TaxID=1356359 RepID=A0A367RWS4_NOSPU|nr:hypothetical protein A6769_03460 [Nostoc punctiforme NIES-2108]